MSQDIRMEEANSMEEINLAPSSNGNNVMMMEDHSKVLSPNGASMQVEQAMARSISPGNLSQGSVSSLMETEPEEKGELDVKVIQSAKPQTLKREVSSQYTTDMDRYNMVAYPRGLALIVEIEKFENDVHDQRIGSHYDVKNLTDLFQQLHFKVEVDKNPEMLQLRKLIEDFSQRQEHTKSNMMILVVLSHGGEGVVYTADGLPYSTERIFEAFNNQNCPNLIGKPKFFIIQACRGQGVDTGHEEMLPMSDESKAKTKSKKRRTPGTAMDSVPFKPEALTNARPTWEDMIIAYSTIPGFASIRDHHHGTWFIQSLVEVFMNFAHERELIDLLRLTSQRLSQFTNSANEKQTCNIEMRHLYKRIYFNPGVLPEDATRQSPAALKRSLSTPPTSPMMNVDLNK